MSICLGLYGNDGLLPPRLEQRYSGQSLWELLLSSPSLLWLGPQLGLDTHTAMELLCLVGAALSLAAMLVEALRDSVVFFCLWALYLSIYQVRSNVPQFTVTGCCRCCHGVPALTGHLCSLLSGGPGFSLLPMVSDEYL